MLDASDVRQVRLLDRNQVPDILPQWRELAGNSLDANVYYSPRYALALLDTVERHTDVRFVTVWKGASLVCLFPVVLHRFSVPGVRPGGAAWQSLYTFSCVPLIDRRDAKPAMRALLDGLAELCAGDWLIPLVYLDGALFETLTTAITERGVPWRSFGSFQRAQLTPGATFEEHMTVAVGNKRRRNVARNRRRLEAEGTVALETCTSGPELARAVEAFLRIEANGWKGRRGTALASHPDSREFALRAFAADEPGACRADLLTLAGNPIAASMTVFSGDTGFTVKCAYDERYAKFGAGLLLEVETIRSFLETPWCARLDAATLTSHVIDSLWPGRREVGILAFSFAGAAAQLRVSGLRNTHRALARAKTAAKRVLRRG